MGVRANIESMTINGEPIKIQNGWIYRSTEKVIFWMGTPPSKEELEPRERLTISWDRALVPVGIDLDENFTFSIVAEGNMGFTGKASYLGLISISAFSKWQAVLHAPLVISFKED